MSDPYRVAVVCLGNICRSPTAEVVLRDRVRAAGLDDRVEVVSAGTSRWELGNPMDPRAARELRGRGYDVPDRTAQQFDADDFAAVDLVLAMDASNLDDLLATAPDQVAREKVRMFRDFDPEGSDGDREVPDPWYGGQAGFAEVLRTVERTSDAIVADLPRLLG
ncbi:MAG: low molecular weight protein-tyrosine-phosphatase [Nocardioidaceae bacterium]|nr:low molecular weight protein-tyrosine-phosphatase [Nocardioidaceae bacterium]